MAARVTTLAFDGVDFKRVEAEVQLTSGQMAFCVVGLGDKAVAESRERVRGAFAGLSTGFTPFTGRDRAKPRILIQYQSKSGAHKLKLT